jgi:hypothetical protein
VPGEPKLGRTDLIAMPPHVSASTGRGMDYSETSHLLRCDLLNSVYMVTLCNITMHTPIRVGRRILLLENRIPTVVRTCTVRPAEGLHDAEGSVGAHHLQAALGGVGVAAIAAAAEGAVTVSGGALERAEVGAVVLRHVGENEAAVDSARWVADGFGLLLHHVQGQVRGL